MNQRRARNQGHQACIIRHPVGVDQSLGKHYWELSHLSRIGPVSELYSHQSYTGLVLTGFALESTLMSSPDDTWTRAGLARPSVIEAMGRPGIHKSQSSSRASESWGMGTDQQPLRLPSSMTWQWHTEGTNLGIQLSQNEVLCNAVRKVKWKIGKYSLY